MKDKFEVWLVEDNDLFRDTITELIHEHEQYRPMPFRSCEDMLEALDSPYLPQVVLMDIELPGIDGIEGVRRLKARSPSSQVIMLTVHEDNDRVFDAICAGASGYLLKSAPAEEVLDAIALAQRGGAPMNGQIARKVLQMFQRFAVPQTEYDLTERELEILQHLVDGRTKRQIADVLFISFYTVDTHLRNIYAKLHVHSRSGAVAKALKERLL